ncbi:DUF1661 domain-containing protein [Porphyromonas gulae]|uniref:DUF1661 domain-containing protein n=1 Tax=Porphyromonas gulae TaxID=111105 RepID=UPI003743B536
MARDFFTSRATAKKISRRFSGKHAPQSEHFRLVFYTPALAPLSLQRGFLKIARSHGYYISYFLANKHKKICVDYSF